MYVLYHFYPSFLPRNISAILTLPRPLRRYLMLPSFVRGQFFSVRYNRYVT